MALTERMEVLDARKRAQTITIQPIEDEQMKCFGVKCQACLDLLNCPAHRAEVWP